eukprot:5107160-Prymnesium_polylepis.1
MRRGRAAGPYAARACSGSMCSESSLLLESDYEAEHAGHHHLGRAEARAVRLVGVVHFGSAQPGQVELAVLDEERERGEAQRVGEGGHHVTDDARGERA